MINNPDIDRADSHFLTMALNIMGKHGCRFGRAFDADKRILDISGPDLETELACAEEIDHALNRHVRE